MTVHTIDDADVDVTTRGRAHGFTLLQRELDTGQLVWAWTNPNQTNQTNQPRFLTRRQALAYMDDWLRHRPGGRPARRVGRTL